MMTTQRDLVATGLKVVGLCVLALGILGFIRGTFRCVGACYAYKHPPKTWINTKYASPEEIKKTEKENEEQRGPHEFAWRTTLAQHVATLSGFFLQTLVGLYLCKRGTLVLNFLVPGCPVDERARGGSPRNNT